MKEAFINKKRTANTLAAIQQIDAIVEEYAAQGFQMTVRQIFYQHVARDLLPNSGASYQIVQRNARRGREEGLIDWANIEDRNRETVRWRSRLSPEAALEETAEDYAEDPWLGQRYKPIVWIEKAALINVIEPACSDWHVPYLANRGYVSVSELYQTAKLLAAQIEAGLEPIIFSLGDHDPSGLDMTRNITEKLALYARTPITVQRLALNMDQIETYNPPPNPAKETDKRYAVYVDEYGPDCWELDALEPSAIDTLLRDAIRALVNQRKWRAAKAQEAKHKKTIAAVAERWADVVQHLGEDDDEDDDQDEDDDDE